LNKSLVIIPTYNEKENLPLVLDALLSQQCGTDVLIVDDNSPDGTAEIAREYGKQHPEVQLLLREKKDGLARAYLAGFDWGLKRHYDNFIEMDADLSHDPKDVPRLIEALKAADAVVGSRYVKGGGTEGWDRFRQLISRGGNIYAKLVLSVKYEDLTGGYNAWTRKTLKEIDLSAIQSKGYAFQVEMKYRAHRRGLKIVEIPILFRNRIHGVSKMSHHIVTEAALKVLKLRNQV
jgi:dolichol-phosphate mannosyltransferase